ncbi:MAG: hypothetical protein ABSD21_06050 [Rhizomicrobium sp.]|jgi:hypothetical protein
MKSILLALATAGALVGGGALAMQMADAPQTESATLHPQRIIIGLDLSRSNPLIADPAFAARVGARIADIVRNLGFASEVHVRTFGNYDATSNNWAYDEVLSVRERPENVAAEIQKLVAGTPLLVKTGKWRAQENTNILAFLDNLSHSIGCAGMPTTIILASDGIEDSGYAKLYRAGAQLPAPDGKPFAGCAEFEILGLGQGGDSPRLTNRLRGEWSGWAQAGGFARFQGLNDW